MQMDDTKDRMEFNVPGLQVFLCENCMIAEKLKTGKFFATYGCNSPISFLTKDGVKTMLPGKDYDENLEEI